MTVVGKNIIFVITTVLTAAVTLLAGCGAYSVKSIWLDREMTIDGHDDDWRNATVHKDDINCAVGIMNDSENIYISLTPWEKATQSKIITTGLTVWFDTSGKEEKKQGITFPLSGVSNNVFRPMIGTKKETAQFMEQFSESQKNLQLINVESDEPVTLSLDEAGDMGIHVAVGDAGGRLSYELQVPISPKKTNGFHIDCHPGDTIHIGFETGKIPLPPEDEDSEYEKYIRNGERSTRMITDTNQSRRSNRQYRPMPGRRQPEPFMLWTKVKLMNNKQVEQQ